MSGLGFAVTNPLAWLAVLSLVLVLGNALRLRARAKGFPVTRDVPVAADRSTPARWRWLVAEGVDVTAPTAAAAEAHAEASRLEVLDVLPADLPVDAALDLIRMVDPATYTTDRLAAGRGAGQALLADRETLRRGDIKAAPAMDTIALIGAAVHLKKYAPAEAGFTVAPGLEAGVAGGRRARLRAMGVPVGAAVAGPVIAYAALVAGAIANPLWGGLAALLWWVQPWIVFAGTPLRPRGLGAAVLLRPVREPMLWARTAFGPKGVVAEEEEAKREAMINQSAPIYAAEIAEGVERYLEPRRTDCPWCGSTDLAHLLTAPDLYQGKPGRFTMERCGSCGHVFQNPRLTIEGLGFYYRDFYDGCGENTLEAVFGAGSGPYKARAEMLRSFVTSAPRNWLDVGTGHGHFATIARDVWPSTVFDGLDMTDSIEEAERRGWVDRGYRGMFPDVAPSIAGTYDVVSMSHYLEHTREPRLDLDAAAIALVPGGHLLIEVPDPEWPMGRLLRRFWIPWLQPQHQHMIPIENLKVALAERGLEPVGELRSTSKVKYDITGALFLATKPLHRDADVPWSPRRPGRAMRFAKGVAIAALMPCFFVTILLDMVVSIPMGRKGTGVDYRVVARKVGTPAPSGEAE